MNFGKCGRCGVEDELIHSEFCDNCVTDSDFEEWEKND